jgi:hypothetical protein
MPRNGTVVSYSPLDCDWKTPAHEHQWTVGGVVMMELWDEERWGLLRLLSPIGGGSHISRSLVLEAIPDELPCTPIASFKGNGNCCKCCGHPLNDSVVAPSSPGATTDTIMVTVAVKAISKDKQLDVTKEGKVRIVSDPPRSGVPIHQGPGRRAAT